MWMIRKDKMWTINKQHYTGLENKDCKIFVIYNLSLTIWIILISKKNNPEALMPLP